jgi:hypothetical protein
MAIIPIGRLQHCGATIPCSSCLQQGWRAGSPAVSSRPRTRSSACAPGGRQRAAELRGRQVIRGYGGMSDRDGPACGRFGSVTSPPVCAAVPQLGCASRAPLRFAWRPRKALTPAPPGPLLHVSIAAPPPLEVQWRRLLRARWRKACCNRVASEVRATRVCIVCAPLPRAPYLLTTLLLLCPLPVAGSNRATQP